MSSADNTPDTELRQEIVKVLLDDDKGIGHVDNALLEDIEALIDRTAAERTRAALEGLKEQEQPWYPNRDTGALEKCVPLKAINDAIRAAGGEG